MSARPYLHGVWAGARRAWGSPGELAVRLGFFVVILLVFSSLWQAAMHAAGGSLDGYDLNAIMWYVVAAEGAVIATKPRLIEDIGNDISTGAVAVEMLRPVVVAGLRMATELGEALVRLGFAIAIGAAFMWPTVGPPPSISTALVLFVPAAVLAVACNLALQHAFAAAAFWIEDAKASWFLYQKLVFLLGGMLLPLELLPPWLAGAARRLPFWTTAYGPARILSGHLEWGLVGLQVAWLAGLVTVAFTAFAFGERRLQVAGG